MDFLGGSGAKGKHLRRRGAARRPQPMYNLLSLPRKVMYVVVEQGFPYFLAYFPQNIPRFKLFLLSPDPAYPATTFIGDLQFENSLHPLQD